MEIEKINAKFKKSNIKTLLKEYGIAESSDKLTSSQANDLLRFGTIDKIRNKLLDEGIGKATERDKPIDSEKQQNKVTESEISSNLAAKIRSNKLDGLGVHLDFGITKTIYNGALEIAAREVEKGTKLGNAINKAIQWIDSQINNAEWNNGLFAKHLNDKYKVTPRCRWHLASDYQYGLWPKHYSASFLMVNYDSDLGIHFYKSPDGHYKKNYAQAEKNLFARKYMRYNIFPGKLVVKVIYSIVS